MKGLMGIKRLSDSQGMAFINPSPSSSPFYMKNTLIPLDIAFWNEKGSIVDIIQMEPCHADPCHLYYAAQTYIGAVEMNQGLLRQKAVAIGDRVNLKPRH